MVVVVSVGSVVFSVGYSLVPVVEGCSRSILAEQAEKVCRIMRMRRSNESFFIVFLRKRSRFLKRFLTFSLYHAEKIVSIFFI